MPLSDLKLPVGVELEPAVKKQPQRNIHVRKRQQQKAKPPKPNIKVQKRADKLEREDKHKAFWGKLYDIVYGCSFLAAAFALPVAGIFKDNEIIRTVALGCLFIGLPIYIGCTLANE